MRGTTETIIGPILTFYETIRGPKSSRVLRAEHALQFEEQPGPVGHHRQGWGGPAVAVYFIHSALDQDERHHRILAVAAAGANSKCVTGIIVNRQGGKGRKNKSVRTRIIYNVLGW